MYTHRMVFYSFQRRISSSRAKYSLIAVLGAEINHNYLSLKAVIGRAVRSRRRLLKENTKTGTSSFGLERKDQMSSITG